MWGEGQVALSFLVEGRAGRTRLSCREGQVTLGFHAEEVQGALGFLVEGGAGGTKLLCGGKGRLH